MKIKRTETSPLEKFKYQAALTKKFGKKSLLIYNAIPLKEYEDWENIKESLSDFSEEELNEILKFMESRGMISIREERVEESLEEKEVMEEKEKKVEEPSLKEEKEEEKEILAKKMEDEKEVLSPQVGEEKEMPSTEIEEEKELEIAPQAPSKEEDKEELEIEREEAPQGEEDLEIKPASFEEEKEEGEKEEVETVRVEEGEGQAKVSVEETQNAETQQTQEVEITPVEEEQLNEEEKVEKEGEFEDLEIKPASFEEEKEEPKEESKEEEEIDLSSLTPLENEIFQKFGKDGVLVYRRVKEGYTEDEIYSEFTGEKSKLDKIIEFMKELGYLQEEREEEREKFAPMADYVEEEDKIVEKGEEVKYIKEVKESLIAKARERMLVSLKFKKYGSKVFDSIHKGVDIIGIIKKSKAKISVVEKILDFLEEKEKYITTAVYTREEIKNKFGEDSYIVYKKYGKKGLVFYELIGEDIHLKEIADILEIEDKEKVIEIFMFIHDLLNIEVPIDRDLLLKKLE